MPPYPSMAGAPNIQAALAAMRQQLVGQPAQGLGELGPGVPGGDQLNQISQGYPSQEAMLAALPPRLREAVAAGRQSPESALNRFGQFQSGQLPGQQGQQATLLEAAPNYGPNAGDFMDRMPLQRGGMPIRRDGGPARLPGADGTMIGGERVGPDGLTNSQRNDPGINDPIYAASGGRGGLRTMEARLDPNSQAGQVYRDALQRRGGPAGVGPTPPGAAPPGARWQSDPSMADTGGGQWVGPDGGPVDYTGKPVNLGFPPGGGSGVGNIPPWLESPQVSMGDGRTGGRLMTPPPRGVGSDGVSRELPTVLTAVPSGAPPQANPGGASAPMASGPPPAARKPLGGAASGGPIGASATFGAAPAPAAPAAMKPAAQGVYQPPAAAGGGDAQRIRDSRNVLRQQVRLAMGKG